METQRRQTRKRKRQQRAARRQKLRAWRQSSTQQLEARWYLSDEETSPIGDAISGHPGTPPSLFVSASMQRLATALARALEEDPGIFVITGQAGIGKSTFATWLGAELAATGHRIGAIDCADIARDNPLAILLERLSREARSTPARPSTGIAVIDGAELLAERSLLALPLHMAEAEGAPALRVILIGRSQLATRLDTPDLRQLIPITRFRGTLEPLDELDILRFLRRLGETDDRDAVPIPPDVLQAIAQQSGGRPADVTFLWIRAQTMAKRDGEAMPRAAHIDGAARMLRPEPRAGVARGTIAPIAAVRRRDPARLRVAPRAARRMALSAAAAAACAFLWVAAASLNSATELPGTGPVVAQAQNERSAATLRETPNTPSDSVASMMAANAPAPASGAADSPPNAQPAPTDQPGEQLASAAPATGPSADEAPPAAIPEADTSATTPVASAQAVAPTSGQAAPAKEKPKPAATRLARLDAPPHPRAQLAQNAVASLDHNHQAAPPIVNAVASAAPPMVVAQAEPQCEAYVSKIDYAGSNAAVRGTACHDGAGHWWLMDQHVE